MRVAALYDIHGNLPALNAVLDEITTLNVDEIVIGGDVLPGPIPRETIGRLLELKCPARFIRGNGEVAVLERLAGRNPVGVPEAYQPVIRWVAEQLSPAEICWLSDWPKTLHFDVDGLGSILFCHATPRNENECFTRLTSEAVLLPIFENLNASVVVCGHTHMQFDRMIGKTRIVNAGSVGMPFGEPGADWLLLGPGVELRHTFYNLDEAAERIRQTRYPEASEFAARNVIRPPSAEEMLKIFSRVELQS
jgi:predicted phosphodiesterase